MDDLPAPAMLGPDGEPIPPATPPVVVAPQDALPPTPGAFVHGLWPRDPVTGEPMPPHGAEAGS